MRYFVFYVYGSCQSGDRNAGMAEFDSLDLALEEFKEIERDHSDAQIVIVEGEEIKRR